MTKTEIAKYVKELLTRERLQDALKALKDYGAGKDSQLETTVMMQTGQLIRLLNEKTIGTITSGEYNVQFNSLKHRISMVLDQLEPTGADVNVETLKEMNTMTNNTGITNPKTILFLSASPKDVASLRVNEELRKVKDGMAASLHREKFILEAEPAVQIGTIRRAVVRKRPEFIHFAGHGKKEGLQVEAADGTSQEFPQEGMERLLRIAKETTECVLLNACYSAHQAEVFSKIGGGLYVIGMSASMGDKAAIDFSVAFYESIGEGVTIPEAFNLALVDLSVHGKYKNLPELWFRGAKLNSD